jgi:hypothetical protein
MTAKRGLKTFGDRAIKALIKEFSQLNDKDVFDPMYFKNLTLQQRKDALRAIALIKEKRSGKIKGRTCADGRKQRAYMNPEDVYSPALKNESMMLSLAIDAKEGRHVAIADVEGAYLHADMDEFLVMVFEGELVDFMVQVDRERYAPHVHVTKDGKKLLYVRLKKALYGCIQSALLWWKLLSSTLIQEGFEINPYDPCVANKRMPDGTQCTICWYVDDLKISHVKRSVVDDVIRVIESKFGTMTKSFGNSHTYLGMQIEFTSDGAVQIDMSDYIKEAIEMFPEDCEKGATSPAALHLFKTNPDGILLSKIDRELFHSIVAKLLYVGKKARPDILVAIAFLTSRVTCADADDWKKLRRLLRYLHSTHTLRLTLSIDSLTVVKTWVDAAFAVHEDMKSHTGAIISMGKGALYASSKKQKLNTKSSTEAELVGAGDLMSQVIWTKNFLEAQGYNVENNILYQDNQSAMKLERNGRQSVGPKSRHIAIRYFFIKDRIEKKDINLIYCPTEKMLADYFSKPLQGSLFRAFRDMTLGIVHTRELHIDPFPDSTSSNRSQERVGGGTSEAATIESSPGPRPVRATNTRANSDTDKAQGETSASHATWADVAKADKENDWCTSHQKMNKINRRNKENKKDGLLPTKVRNNSPHSCSKVKI